MSKTHIKEIFSSIQGEGLYVGEMQIFVRFCRCNLNCKYCDTKFLKDKNTPEYESKDLAEYLLHNKISTISLTGGEPLLEKDFLCEFLPLVKNQKKIYLETNGTLVGELIPVLDFVDIIAMDIKLQSATGQLNQFEINDEFLNIAKKKETFVKVVFDKNIEDYEIKSVLKLVKKYKIPLVLQPKMNKNKFASDMASIMQIYEMFYSEYQNVRLIPQTHKFLNIM